MNTQTRVQFRSLEHAHAHINNNAGFNNMVITSRGKIVEIVDGEKRSYDEFCPAKVKVLYLTPHPHYETRRLALHSNFRPGCIVEFNVSSPFLKRRHQNESH